MKTYKETKQAIKNLVTAYGVDGITGQHIVDLLNAGHNGTNLQNAVNYFQFSPKAAKYR